MWEVLQKMRVDRQPGQPVSLASRDGREVHTAKVPTPTLARQHCRWCRILDQDEDQDQEEVKKKQEEEEEDTVYETVELARVEVRRDSASLVVRQRDRERGRDRERAKARERERERTYGEVRERAGRTRERQVETDWRGRSPERTWRGRSPSSSRRSEVEARPGGGWTGRVTTGDFLEPSRGTEWRGRSPGLTGGLW